MSTFDQIKSIIVDDMVTASAEKITPTASFRDDLGFDSLDEVEFAILIERKFGVRISDQDVESWLTIGDAVKHLDRIAAE